MSDKKNFEIKKSTLSGVEHVVMMCKDFGISFAKTMDVSPRNFGKEIGRLDIKTAKDKWKFLHFPQDIKLKEFIKALRDIADLLEAK